MTDRPIDLQTKWLANDLKEALFHSLKPQHSKLFLIDFIFQGSLISFSTFLHKMLPISDPVSVSAGLRWSLLLISTNPPPGKVRKWFNIARLIKAKLDSLISTPDLIKRRNFHLDDESLLQLKLVITMVTQWRTPHYNHQFSSKW